MLKARGQEEVVQMKKQLKDSKNVLRKSSGWRIMPSGLRVSRCLGSAGSKLKECGGIPEAVISEPEVISVNLKENQDFLLLGSSGIFDYLSSQEAVRTIWSHIRIWQTQQTISNETTLKDCICKSINSLLSLAMSKGADENMSLIIILLPSFLSDSL